MSRLLINEASQNLTELVSGEEEPTKRDINLSSLTPEEEKLLLDDVNEFLKTSEDDCSLTKASSPKKNFTNCDTDDRVEMLNETLSSPKKVVDCEEENDDGLLVEIPEDEIKNKVENLTSPSQVTSNDSEGSDRELLTDVPENESNNKDDSSDDDLLADAPSPQKTTNIGSEESEDDLLEELPSPQPKLAIDDKESCEVSPSKSSTTTESENTAKTSFIDSLLDKMRRSNSVSSGSTNSEVAKFQQMRSESEEDLLVEVEPPVTCSKSSNPNLLPTPIVPNQRSISAFVNDEEEYQRTVAKHPKITSSDNASDNCQMGSMSKHPQMQAPEFNYFQRPRTLAEKRYMFKKNIKLLMIEQESKIYKHVQRRDQALQLNYPHLDNMMLEHIPINRGPWKVLTWLRTREGNFIHQYIDLEGNLVKLNGSRGNHRVKVLPTQFVKKFPKEQKTFLRSTRCCMGGKIKRQYFDELLHQKNIQKFVLCDCNEPIKKLENKLEAKYLDDKLVSIKPQPLSKKVELLNKARHTLSVDEDSYFLGDYSTFEMPEITMEVKVKHKAPVDPTAKKYLRAILPHRDLTENWCEFALSALASTKNDEDRRDTFDFTIPYENDKRCILVREILKCKEDQEQLRIPPDKVETEDVEDEMEWTFAKNIDNKDPVECEVIDIIKDLTNSVFININDDLFTQDDPHDRKVSSSGSPQKAEAVEELSTSVKPDRSKRLLIELKRLNANVFVSDSPNIEDEDHMRRYATAHLGKKERELRPTVIVTDSDTVLLGNHEKDSRRIKRAPKKFDDYENSMNTNVVNDSEDEELPKELAKKKMKMMKLTGDDDTYWSKWKSSHKNTTVDDMKTVRKELNKMFHVNVDVHRLSHLEYVEPWCMVHNLYKCECKGEALGLENEQQPVNNSQSIPPIRPIPIEQLLKKQNPPAPTSTTTSTLLSESEEELVDDGFSRRVLPVSRAANGAKPKTALISSQDGMPKLEILNLNELINGGVGPIFINVYDDKTMRLNSITRSVLNNRSAIVYFDGFGYFVDKTRVDVKKLDFSKLKPELEEPIFIIQRKDEAPPPISSTMNDDFIKILFKKNSSEVIQIFDKAALNEISGIIESILRNVKKKISSEIDGEPSQLVKEQLSMLTKDRSRSRSVSSAGSSPLSFRGMKLTIAPPPGTDSQLMKEFNEIFSTRMKRLVALISSNSLGLRPSIEMLNKFYIYKWHLLLRSFEEDLVQVWQVRLESTSGKGFQMMALTESRDVPEIEFAMKENVVNIRKLSLSDDITELTRLILLRVENVETANMTIVFYGCKGYLRMCGILNSREQYLDGFVAKPSRETHPRIAAKIQKTYHIWYASKKKKAAMEKATTSPSKNPPSVEKVPNVSPGTSSNQSDASITNIAKKPGQSDFKWFLFNITNDFSDIFIKTWGRYLSFKVIMEAINRAKFQNRAVALAPNSRDLKKWPRIYALPSAPLKFKEHDTMTENYLIFGPYMRNSNSNLMLMQNVDGELILRDDYEKRNNIKRSTRTRCLWIYANTLKCVQDADPVPLKLMWGNGGNGYQTLHEGKALRKVETKPLPTK